MTVALLIGACAQPQYVNSTNQQADKKGSTNDCLAQFQISRVCVDLKWEKYPTEDGFGSFIFTTTSSTSEVLHEVPTDPSQSMKIILWMPSMGHGSSPVSVEKIAFGVYRATGVYFSMTGDWEIRFAVGVDQAIYALTIQ